MSLLARALRLTHVDSEGFLSPGVKVLQRCRVFNVKHLLVGVALSTLRSLLVITLGTMRRYPQFFLSLSSLCFFSEAHLLYWCEIDDNFGNGRACLPVGLLRLEVQVISTSSVFPVNSRSLLLVDGILEHLVHLCVLEEVSHAITNVWHG